MKNTMETAIEKSEIQVSTFADYKIEKDFSRLTVRITRATKRARFGFKLVAYYSFKRKDLSASIFAMNQYVDKFIDAKAKQEAEKVASKLEMQNARKDFKCEFAVGEIFYTCWGYDATNYDFYQIISIKGKKVTFMELATSREYEHSGYKITPAKDEFIGEEINCLITLNNWGGKINQRMKISNHGLSLYTGGSKYGTER